ncbi:hypothetical protein A4G19_13150 [Pasteurellaceae bacterium Macca]|nr:hypothetical protein [Pasteurellaceae bacterium Macca]MCK3656199.1 hypothetical protein [Pasteurellaceae bacterium Macca]MCK3656215.1 hypothetical protein [Pasteurellaceae bacterium Macca]MCK3656642.1 hypothetical protein [Pasteurellaceae bacterium Macca]
MYKKEVIAYFGSLGEVAKALGVSSSAVSQWREVIPEKNAYRLQILTENKLQVDERLYRQAKSLGE